MAAQRRSRCRPATVTARIEPSLTAQRRNGCGSLRRPMTSWCIFTHMQYRLNEAVGRPFDSTINGARMIASGVFDRHPKLQVLIVHMGGGLTSVVGRLDFNWQLNYKGVRNPPAGRPYINKLRPSEYFKTNILVDCMGFNPPGLRAAIEMCGVDRVVFGSDYGAVPYGIEEHVQIVEDVLPSPGERQQVFWKTSNKVFRLGLPDTSFITPGGLPLSAAA
jgi:predicted TIM-barrel fold metal-dependent hydrolase